MKPNEPVFPKLEHNPFGGMAQVSNGLTIRDYIAIELYKALLSDIEYQKKFSASITEDPCFLAKLAYSHAAALIIESQRGDAKDPAPAAAGTGGGGDAGITITRGIKE